MMRRASVDPQALDAIFAPYRRCDAPGLVVGVAVDGEPAYRRGFGLANFELPVCLTPTIRLRIGSVSKHFLSLLLLMLAEDGKLSVDDTPRRALPELPSWAERMTVRQWMSHTSGMRCSLDLLLQTGALGKAVSADAQFELLCMQRGVNFEPGGGWCYNNGAYALLGRIAERVTGKRLGELLRKRLFEPAGMRGTQLRPLDTDLRANSAVLHVPAANGGYTRGVFGPAIGGEGGIVSTVDDMLRWMASMARHTVATADSWGQLCTPLTSHGYGLGLHVGSYRGVRILHHAGMVSGGACQMIKVLDPEVDVIVISNCGGIDPAALALKVVEACVPALEDAPRDDESIALVHGDFYSEASGAFVRLFGQQGKQMGQNFLSQFPLRRHAADLLRTQAMTSDAQIVLQRRDDGITAISFAEFGRTEVLQRVRAPKEGLRLGMMIGDYDCREASAEASIRGEDGRVGLKVRGAFGAVDYFLDPVGPDLCLASTGNPLLPLGGLLEFDGRRGFRFSSQRTRRLPFVRKQT